MWCPPWVLDTPQNLPPPTDMLRRSQPRAGTASYAEVSRTLTFGLVTRSEELAKGTVAVGR